MSDSFVSTEKPYHYIRHAVLGLQKEELSREILNTSPPSLCTKYCERNSSPFMKMKCNLYFANQSVNFVFWGGFFAYINFQNRITMSETKVCALVRVSTPIKLIVFSPSAGY